MARGGRCSALFTRDAAWSAESVSSGSLLSCCQESSSSYSANLDVSCGPTRIAGWQTRWRASDSMEYTLLIHGDGAPAAIVNGGTARASAAVQASAIHTREFQPCHPDSQTT